MKIPARCLAFLAWTLLAAGVFFGGGWSAAQASAKQRVFLDTDIGDDIDDAFALGLLLESPEVQLLGISTAYGDTELRARLVDRFLKAVDRTEIPVAKGVATKTTNVFTQEAYARRQPGREYADGVSLLLEQIRRHPGEVTLIAIGPLGNIRAAIARDPGTFRQLKRVVMMGGSVHRGYGPVGTSPQVEWNAGQDPVGLKALLDVGVPVFVMPLDSTQIALDAASQDRIFGHGSDLTDQLAALYHQWKLNSGWHPTGPNLYDPTTVAYLLKPGLCPMTPMRLEVDQKGMTRPIVGAANSEVCLKSDEKGFVELLEERLAPAQR